MGLPEIDESAVMAAVVPKVQGSSTCPCKSTRRIWTPWSGLCGFTTAKAMVNSVNGKAESMEAVFPLVQKYGGVVVALTIDEEGIPKPPRAAKNRRKIVKTAGATASISGTSSWTP